MSSEAATQEFTAADGKATARRGRPSPYAEERCRQIIEIMSAGFTVTAAAGKMGVDRGTIYRWAKSHSEFCNALGIAKAKRVLHWEHELLTTEDPTRVRVCIAALKMDEPYRGQFTDAIGPVLISANRK